MDIELSAEQLIAAFESNYRSNIKRDGSEDLLNWMRTETDFFTAPASTMYHLSRPSGLVLHSLHVYFNMVKLNDLYKFSDSQESLAICGLLHDVCKIGLYSTDYRNKKTEDGAWIKQAYYDTSKEVFPYGHGEKSVFLIMKKMQLTDEEAMAINWHMGGFDPRAKDGFASRQLSAAQEKYPLAFWLHIADNIAAHHDEKDM